MAPHLYEEAQNALKKAQDSTSGLQRIVPELELLLKYQTDLVQTYQKINSTQLDAEFEPSAGQSNARRQAAEVGTPACCIANKGILEFSQGCRQHGCGITKNESVCGAVKRGGAYRCHTF